MVSKNKRLKDLKKEWEPVEIFNEDIDEMHEGMAEEIRLERMNAEDIIINKQYGEKDNFF